MTNPRSNPKMAQKKSAGKKKADWSLFGTRWIASPDQLSINWPTLPWAGPLGCCGLVVGIAVWPFLFTLEVKIGDPYAVWEWTLLANFLSIMLIVIGKLVKESFSISRKQAQRTRWPSFLRPRQVIPTDQIIKVIVQLTSRNVTDENGFDVGVEHRGTVKVKVRCPDGIDWWNLGYGLGSSHAISIGKKLSRFVKVSLIDKR